MYPVRRQISSYAAQLRRDRTDGEDAIWHGVRDRQCGGVRFQFQSSIFPYVFDFLCIEARLIVEIDGGRYSQASDARRTAFLEARGYRIIRFWNSDVLAHRDGVLEAIRLALIERMHEKKKTLTQRSPMKMREG